LLTTGFEHGIVNTWSIPVKRLVTRWKPGGGGGRLSIVVHSQNRIFLFESGSVSKQA
jgi:hypothetical protein